MKVPNYTQKFLIAKSTSSWNHKSFLLWNCCSSLQQNDLCKVGTGEQVHKV